MNINEEQRVVLDLAIEIYGDTSQIDKCIEEMSELTKALLKNRYAEEFNVWPTEFDVVEEIADVVIMAEQVAIIYGEKAVEGKIREKVDRLAKRLHGEV